MLSFSDNHPHNKEPNPVNIAIKLIAKPAVLEPKERSWKYAARCGVVPPCTKYSKNPPKDICHKTGVFNAFFKDHAGSFK